MAAKTIPSYLVAIERIRQDGHLFDVGQISVITLRHLDMARRMGYIKSSRDSYPIRGCGPGSGEQMTVYELTEYGRKLLTED